MDLSVIVPTHNPHRGRLGRALQGLRSQTLAADRWETLVIDNASQPPLAAAEVAPAPPGLRIVREAQLGLTSARRAGLRESRAPLCVFVDDDNVLAPDYLAVVVRRFGEHPEIGALGGRSLPEFEAPPPAWARAFDDLLACRDLGEQPLFSHGLRDPVTGRNEYPVCAPIGAGLALRRAAIEGWIREGSSNRLSDRRGGELTSGGDNDIVLALLQAGWEVGYFPELRLTHLIPAGRLEAGYLGRLNRGIQKSWMQVLAKYDANPWPPIAPWTVPLRQAKAWFTHRAWSGPAARIRWQGVCGHFEGRIPA